MDSLHAGLISALALFAISLGIVMPVRARLTPLGDATDHAGADLPVTPQAATTSSSPLVPLPPTSARPPPPAPLVDNTASNDVFSGPLPFATAQCNDGWFSY